MVESIALPFINSANFSSNNFPLKLVAIIFPFSSIKNVVGIEFTL